MARISFILPFYNEEHTLSFVMDRLKQVMDKESDDYAMVFVNDASTDGSVKVIENEAKKNNSGEIVLVNMSRRFGVEESFMAGIQAATGDALILMYTDMQDPPEVVHTMLKSYREGAEIVHTIRRKRIGDHPFKKMAAFLAYRIISKLSEIKIPYDAGEFKLISKNVAKHLLKLPETEPYLRGLIPWIGFKQTYIEYDMQPRIGGVRKVPLFGKKAWSVFLNGVISFSDFPIYLILLIGLGGIFSAAVLGVWLSLTGIPAWMDPSDVLIIFLWATLMSALGLLGLYVLKIYKNTRGRPPYIIKEVVKFNSRVSSEVL